MQIRYKQYATNIFSLVAGGVLPLAFAPWHYFWLAPLSAAVLLIIWQKSSPLRAAINGWIFGLGMFGVGVSWVYISIHTFGGTSIPLAALLTALFVMTLSLFPAVQGYCFTRFFKQQRPIKIIITFPVCWVLFEWLRSYIFTGFPWLLLGYSQTNSLLRGYAAIIGVYGVTFLVALSAALIVAIIIQLKKRNHFVWIGYLVVLILIWVIGGKLAAIQWTQPTGKAIKVSIVQGNIPQQIKWSPNQIIPTIQRYTNLTKPYWRSKIILWPEAAIPLPLPYAQNVINQLSARAKKNHTSLILGIPVQIGNKQYYNAAIAIGAGSGKYYKQRLVPFGEYVPFENILRGLFAFFNLPMSEFITGPKNQAPLLANNVPVAPYICYEVAYDSLVRQDLPQAQILITISDDAWFGQSIAAEQHLQIGQMRCLETGRYMLFSTNNGVTAIIGPQGKIIQRIARFKPGVLTNKIYPMKNATPYVIAGSWPTLLMSLVLGLISLLR